jgi:hypothetical protein
MKPDRLGIHAHRKVNHVGCLRGRYPLTAAITGISASVFTQAPPEYALGQDALAQSLLYGQRSCGNVHDDAFCAR